MFSCGLSSFAIGGCSWDYIECATESGCSDRWNGRAVNFYNHGNMAAYNAAAYNAAAGNKDVGMGRDTRGNKD